MPRSIRACRIVGNALKAPSSVRWLTFAIIAAHISRADNVLRNDRRYRVVYEVFDDRVIVIVLKVGHRKDIYK